MSLSTFGILIFSTAAPKSSVGLIPCLSLLAHSTHFFHYFLMSFGTFLDHCRLISRPSSSWYSLFVYYLQLLFFHRWRSQVSILCTAIAHMTMNLWKSPLIGLSNIIYLTTMSRQWENIDNPEADDVDSWSLSLALWLACLWPWGA